MSSSSRSQPGARQFPGNCTLERALQTVVDVFHQYSSRQGELDLLSIGDFRTLLAEQAPNFLGTCDRNRAGYLDKLFQETDLNKDKELSFEEFTIVLSKLADDAHRISHGSERCGPDRD
ncbi:PREDICTED: protein S100-A7A-like [Sturnus vulgaris]|uniref:protein S100-A7A-like n=1 Tax=Sturnus vulgaris TaxID=9172 RepID=UPI00071AAC19|nr:PREDICTED: protein S100-A7A-like [Sturnus vulgaris]